MIPDSLPPRCGGDRRRLGPAPIRFLPAGFFSRHARDLRRHPARELETIVPAGPDGPFICISSGASGPFSPDGTALRALEICAQLVVQLRRSGAGCLARNSGAKRSRAIVSQASGAAADDRRGERLHQLTNLGRGSYPFLSRREWREGRGEKNNDE